MRTRELGLRTLERKLQRSCWQIKACRPDEIELIVVATVTPDMLFPSTACLIQDRLGASHAWGFDLSGACSGFIYALTTARNSSARERTRKRW